MIAVDTSALLAIVLGKPESDACIAALEADPAILISAGTVTEALVVSTHNDVREEVAGLIAELGMQIVPVTLASATRAANAHARWGKGIHPAALNFGDCFAYEVAKENGCRLLYVGGDFAKTDIESAL